MPKLTRPPTPYIAALQAELAAARRVRTTRHDARIRVYKSGERVSAQTIRSARADFEAACAAHKIARAHSLSFGHMPHPDATDETVAEFKAWIAVSKGLRPRGEQVAIGNRLREGDPKAIDWLKRLRAKHGSDSLALSAAMRVSRPTLYGWLEIIEPSRKPTFEHFARWLTELDTSEVRAVALAVEGALGLIDRYRQVCAAGSPAKTVPTE